MADREELELNLKTTADTSGIDALRSKIDALKKDTQGGAARERERPLTPEQAAQQGLTLASTAELNRSFLTQRDLQRRRIEAEAERIRTAPPPALFSPARGTIEEAAARANQPQVEEVQTPLGTIQRQIQDAKQVQAEKLKIDKEYAANQARDRQTAEKEELASQGRLYTAHKTQTAEYIKLYQQAQKEGRVTQGASPAGAGGPPIPPNIQTLLSGGDGGGSGGNRGGFQLNRLFDSNTTSLLRFTAALFGAGIGINIFSTAGRELNKAITDLIKSEEEAIQATVNLNAAYGSAAQSYGTLIQTISQGATGAGFFKVSDVQQSLAALKPLADQLRLTKTQTDELISSAAQLANIHDIPLTQASQALTEALQGNSSAAAKLGLNLSDVEVAAKAANGQFATTFSTLPQSEQAALRLAVAEQQIGNQAQATTGKLNPLSQSVRELATAWETLNKTFGETPVNTASGAILGIAKSLELVDAGVKKIQQLPDWAKVLIGLPAAPIIAPAAAVVSGAVAANRVGQNQQQQQLVSTQRPEIQHIAQVDRSVVTLTSDLKAAKEAADAVFAKLAQDAPQITQAIGQITGAVQNIGVLSGPQRAALVERQAELGALKQQQLLTQQNTQSQYSNLSAVKALVPVYDNLAKAQQAQNLANIAVQQRQAVVQQLDIQEQQRHLGIANDLAALQIETLNRQGNIVDLTRQEADLQDRINVAARDNLDLQDQLIQARQAARPAQYGAEDIQREQQLLLARANAIRANVIRGTEPASDLGQIADIRKQLIDLARRAPEAQFQALAAQQPQIDIQRQIDQEHDARQLILDQLARQQRALQDEITPLQEAQRITDEQSQQLQRQVELQDALATAAKTAAQQNLLNAQAIETSSKVAVTNAQLWVDLITSGLATLQKAEDIAAQAAGSGQGTRALREGTVAPGGTPAQVAGGNTVNINFTGPVSVRGDEDVNQIAQQAAAMTLQALTHASSYTPTATPTGLAGAYSP